MFSLEASGDPDTFEILKYNFPNINSQLPLDGSKHTKIRALTFNFSESVPSSGEIKTFPKLQQPWDSKIFYWVILIQTLKNIDELSRSHLIYMSINKLFKHILL